jgi:hypothetical protein
LAAHSEWINLRRLVNGFIITLLRTGKTQNEIGNLDLTLIDDLLATKIAFDAGIGFAE